MCVCVFLVFKSTATNRPRAGQLAGERCEENDLSSHTQSSREREREREREKDVSRVLGISYSKV